MILKLIILFKIRINKLATKPGNAVFSVRDLVVKDDLDVTRVKNVNLDIHEGEILGLAGVTGNGQTELLEALSGIRKIESGEIIFIGIVNKAYEFHMGIQMNVRIK